MTSGLATVWRYVKLALGGLLVVFSAISMLAPSGSILERMAELETQGLMTKATVTKKTANSKTITKIEDAGFGFSRGVEAGKRLAKGTEVDDSDYVTKETFAVDYEFRIPNAEPIKRSVSVSAAEYDTLKVGTKIDVVYHPADPTIHRAVAYTQPIQQTNTANPLVVGLSMLALGLFLVFRNYRFSDASAPTSRLAPATERTMRAPAQAGAAPRAPMRASPVQAGRQVRRSGFGQRN